MVDLSISLSISYMAFRKSTVKFVSKEELTNDFFEVIFELKELESFEPGQYINIKVDEKAWRSYSILKIIDNKLYLLIDIKPGGIGSKFFQNIAPDYETDVVYPLGEFILTDNKSDKTFIATSSGISPFIPMIIKLRKEGFKKKIKLLYGIRQETDVLFERYLANDLDVEIITCVTQPSKNYSGYKGRVTKALIDLDLVDPDCEYYVCGGPEMVTDVKNILEQNECKFLNFERY